MVYQSDICDAALSVPKVAHLMAPLYVVASQTSQLKNVLIPPSFWKYLLPPFNAPPPPSHRILMDR